MNSSRITEKALTEDTLAENTLLEVNHLSVTLNDVPLVRDVSLSLHAGQLVGIVGANGAGKTTLLNGIVNPVSTHARKIDGEVFLCSKVLSEYSVRSTAKQIAFLSQMSALNFPYTVSEVVELSRIPHATGEKIDRDIVDQALALLDITHLKQRLYTQLSGGEKQRVQLARVMAQIWRQKDAAHRLLILDEPNAFLDLGHQQQLMSAIRTFADQGVGILMVAHDINLMSQYADGLIALCCGEVVAQGYPNDVVTVDNMRKVFAIDSHVIAHPATGKPIIV